MGRPLIISIITIFVVLKCAPGIADQVRIGTTYSRRQCEYLGIDWKKTYIAILDTGFDIIRLGAYWDEIEKKKGEYDFSRLDWEINEARRKNIPVILAVGMKAPRWPEYYIPEWVIEKTHPAYGANLAKNVYLKEKTLDFIEKVVTRYGGEPIVQYWQVENEPLNRIGSYKWYIGRSFLKQEVEFVRKLDGKGRPIILTVATYPNRFLRFFEELSTPQDPVKECLELCDIIGINIYPTFGYKFLWFNIYFNTTPGGREKYFSKLLKRIRNKRKKVWITELQAEPWEPGHLVYKEKDPPPTGMPETMEESFREFRDMGVDTVLLWGAEYWRFRAVRYGDTEWERTVRNLLGRPR
ncbi:MAG: beta-galactosidase [Candidatus Omnitrophota bacterium]|nr:beta-galactosidase [Candidatus Omnitrophota bacterium]